MAATTRTGLAAVFLAPRRSLLRDKLRPDRINRALRICHCDVPLTEKIVTSIGNVLRIERNSATAPGCIDVQATLAISFQPISATILSAKKKDSGWSPFLRWERGGIVSVSPLGDPAILRHMRRRTADALGCVGVQASGARLFEPTCKVSLTI